MMVSGETIQWAKVRSSEYAMEPSRAHDNDAGFDLYASQNGWINPGEFRDIPTNVRVRLPAEAWAMLTGRSSTLRKHGLLVNQGVIDTGYTGELYAGAFNLTGKPVEFRVGQRLAQLILMPNVTKTARMWAVPWEAFGPDEAGARGTQGFGSSGI